MDNIVPSVNRQELAILCIIVSSQWQHHVPWNIRLTSFDLVISDSHPFAYQIDINLQSIYVQNSICCCFKSIIWHDVLDLHQLIFPNFSLNIRRPITPYSEGSELRGKELRKLPPDDIAVKMDGWKRILSLWNGPLLFTGHVFFFWGGGGGRGVDFEKNTPDILYTSRWGWGSFHLKELCLIMFDQCHFVLITSFQLTAQCRIMSFTHHHHQPQKFHLQPQKFHVWNSESNGETKFRRSPFRSPFQIPVLRFDVPFSICLGESSLYRANITTW